MITTSAKSCREGMVVPRVFSTEGVSPFDQVQWESRTAEIKDENGRVIFQQDGCEIPKGWSHLATNVVASKYFYGEIGTPERESSVRDLIHRVTRTIADWGREDGYFATPEDSERFYDELTSLCLNQYGSFNSPVWFNVGLFHQYGVAGAANNWRWDEEAREAVKADNAYEFPQSSACFIQSVADDMQDIMRLATSEAMLFKYGSGTGTDLSTLRSSKEKLAGGGKPSGPVSFMRVYDSIASVIKSGGKCLAYDQPVFTAEGPKTAKELAERGGSFEVLSYSKRLGRVAVKTAQAWFSGEKQLVEVVTDKGTFRVSQDHPFMLRTGECRAADSLAPGLSLMPITASPMSGYAHVRLNDDAGGRELLHRMVAQDVMGLSIQNKTVHHIDGNKEDSRPANLEVLSGQSAHAKLHNDQLVDKGIHGFQTARYPKAGRNNGMHRDGDFWGDPVKSQAYRETQRTILTESGRAALMQSQAVRHKMLNLGYELINAGYDISTFDSYCQARLQHGRRVSNKPRQAMRFVTQFGSYDDFLIALSAGNHRVLSVRPLGVESVVSVEVFDDEPDDKRDWSEHNYAICPLPGTGKPMNALACLNTRRAAKIQTLKDWHPDILEFIECKAKEEAKAHALIRAGYEANFNGDAYSSVMFQNANLSIRATDAFLHAVEAGEEWTTRAVTTGQPMQSHPAGELMDKIAEGTWLCGDPGLQYEDTIQRWHTCPNTAPINSSNPCSEYMFIDDSACNLSSINLMKFRCPGGAFGARKFRAACRIFITAQEILVDHASYPTDKIAENSHKFRPLGLGFANLGSLLMSLGIPYDSDEGRAVAGSITAIMHGQAYLTSAEHAANVGPFEGFALNRDPMLRVMNMHRDALEKIGPHGPASLLNEARAVWDECIDAGREHGFRNSQATVLAPTGTIAFMMDCDTTGVEPDIALVKYKSLAGGGMLKIVNRTLPMALGKLGYDDSQTNAILEHVYAHDTIEGAPGLLDKHLPVFDCAFPPPQGGRSISWLGHLRMMSAVQPFLSGAISKTVNMPREATVKDIRDAYLEGWKLGLKAMAIYRDGSKGSQPVSTKSEGAEPAKPTTPAPPTVPRRDRLPGTRRSLTHKFDIQGHEGYATVGFYPDGRPGELFVTMAKEGSTIGGLMDVLGTSVSIGLQYGVPLDVFVNKFAHSRFEPAGFTRNPDIPIAKSIADYIFRWLGMEFIAGYRESNAPRRDDGEPETVSVAVVNQHQQFSRFQSDAPACDNCGAITIRSGTCYRCGNCGNSMGCS